MASTEEVLKALQNAKIATLAAPEPEELVIDAETRTITVPSSERLFGVTGDMNIERKYFRCPKIVGDNIDLSTHQIFIAYVYTETESGSIFPSIGVAPYHCEDVEVDGEDITFSWKLTGNVFKNPGFILFKMYAKRTETDPNTVFNTTPAIGTVLATIPDGTEEIKEEYPDAIAQIFDRLDALESGGGGTGGTTNYENLSNKPQLNGVTLEGNKTLDQVGVLAKNQGSNNSGKFLSVGSDGNVVPADAPSGGTVDPEQIEQAVNGYLEENPPSGMTSEQEEQLGKVWIEDNPSYTITDNRSQIFDTVENGKANKITITDGSDYWDGEPEVSYPGTLNVKTLRENRFYANMWLPNGMDMDQSYRYAADKNGQIRLYDILNQKSDLTGLSPWGICLKGEGKSFPTGQCHFIISKIRVLGLDSNSGKWKLVKTCKPIAALFDIAQTSAEGTFVDVDRTVLSDDMYMFSIRQSTSWTMAGDMCFHFYPENTDAVTKEDIQDCSRILIAFRIRVQEAENSGIFTCSCGCDALGGTGVEAFFSRFNAVTDTLQELSSNNCLESESNILTDNLEAINELIYKEESIVSDEQVKGAVDSYLEENPVSGMTAEQEQQLNQNTADVSNLKSALPDKLDTNQGAENKGKSMVVGEDGGVIPVEFDINGKEMDISIDGSNTLIELLQKICDKLQIKYGIKLYSNYLGFVTPMDGAYSDWVYNNIYPIDDKIYFSYMFPQTHWNQKKDSRSRMCVYDTKTKTYEYWERICEGESFAASATIYDPDDATFYSFNSECRYKSTDNGRTWEKEDISGMPNSPHYLTRLSNGSLIVAPDSTTLHQFAKSTDKGLTWSTFNPFLSSYNLSHCRFFEIDDGTVVAYFFNPYISSTSTDRESESTRYFSVSTDYGETWTEPEKCKGELEKAGVSYMTGAFAYYGNVYHYITAERLPETNKPEKIGRIRWFSGSKEELLSGNLKLVEEIDSVIAKSLNGKNGWNSTSISDSGNIGCCVGSDGLYVIFGSILDQFYTTSSFICSNQGLKMFRLGTVDIGNKKDEYYDETQMERLDKLYSEKSKDHTLYIFDDQTTNIEGVELFGIESQYAIPKVAKKIIPVGTGDFEVNAIFTFKNFGITNDLWSSYAPYMPIGFQTSDGTLHGFLGKETNQYGLNAGSTDATNNPFMLACGNGKAYITIKRESGHLFFTLNGATITDPIYDNYAYKENYMLPEVTQDSLVWNYEPGSEEGAFLNFLDSNSADWNKRNIVSGFKMLTIDIPSF